MIDKVITSYQMLGGPVVYDNDDIPRPALNPIGTDCGCPCHPWPGTWGKNEPTMCCGTLHQRREIADVLES